MKAARLAILGVLLLLGLLVPGVWAGELPEPTGFVNDFAGVLTAEQQAALESRCKALEASHGDELAIAIFQDLPADYATTKELATALFNTWHVGKKDTDNGVLVVLALGPRRVEIETGYGVEDVLPDQLCGRLLRKYAVPSFKQDEWYEGLDALSKALVKILEKAKPYREPLLPRLGEGLAAAVGLLFLLLIGGLFFWALIIDPIYQLIRGVRCPKCGAKMKFVRRIGRKKIYECPVCGARRTIYVPETTSSSSSWSSSSSSSFFSSSSSSSSFGGFGGGSSGGGGAGASF